MRFSNNGFAWVYRHDVCGVVKCLRRMAVVILFIARYTTHDVGFALHCVRFRNRVADWSFARLKRCRRNWKLGYGTVT